MAMSFSDEEYYYKADNLIKQSCPTLQSIYRARWRSTDGTQWSEESAEKFISGIGKALYKSAKRIQKEHLRSGKLDDWDVSLLSMVIQSLKPPSDEMRASWEMENEAVRSIARLRNDLAHNSTSKLTQTAYYEIESKYKTAMLNCGVLTETEVGKLIRNAGVTSSVTALEQMKKITADAKDLKQNKMFREAIKLYDEALMVPSLLPVNKGSVLEDRAECYIFLAKEKFSNPNSKDLFDQAAADAADARGCNNESWRAHFVTAKVLKEQHDLEKALQHFNRALAISPGQSEVKKELDICRLLNGELSRDEHMDPRKMPMTLPELLQGLQDESGIPMTEEMYFKVGEIASRLTPGEEHVQKGHRCMNGWTVEQNYQEAAAHYAKAAMADHAEGIYNLSLLHQSGKGVKQDIPYAVELLRRAASLPSMRNIRGKSVRNLGVAEAHHSLGIMYSEGVGVPMNQRVAAEWYRKAADLGSGPAANNLGNMYAKGEGVLMDKKKAEIYWKLAVEQKDMNAAHSLYRYYLKEMENDAAKEMFDAAIRLGYDQLRLIKDEVYKEMEEGRRAREEAEEGLLKFERDQGGLSTRGMTFMERMDRMMESFDPVLEGRSKRLEDLEDSKTYKFWAGQLRDLDIKDLLQRVREGSITACRILATLDKRNEFIDEWGDGPPFTENKTAKLVDILYFCITTEHQIIQMPVEMETDFVKFFEELIRHIGAQNCDLDRKIRACWCYISMFTSPDDDYNLEVVKEGVRRYPEEVHLHKSLSDMYGNRNDHESGLKAAEDALKLFPEDVDLLYNFAVHTRLSQTYDNNNKKKKTRKAYKAFVEAAPIDHRKLPEAYYALAVTYMSDINKSKNESSDFQITTNKAFNQLINLYRIGQEMETKQVKCYLPYESGSKSLLMTCVKLYKAEEDKIANQEATSSSTVASAIAVPQEVRKTFLDDPKRLSLITSHREMLKNFRHNPPDPRSKTTKTPKLVHKIPKIFTDLKSIKLKEMDPTKDHIYENRLLNLTIIEDPVLGHSSIHLIAEDDDGDVTRLYIYNVPHDKETDKSFGFGCRLSVINPYMRMAADMKNAIRVDDPKCLLYNERKVDMCRYCGDEKAPHNCSKCKWAKYCSRECQMSDWKKLSHKFICIPEMSKSK